MVKFIQAVLILSGMIIGAGMFGIPFSFAQSGFLIGVLELFILAGVVLSLHFLYGEIVLRTPGGHQLPGYVKIYLQKRGEYFALFSTIFGIWGTLLAYLLIGSKFLQNIFHNFWPGGSEQIFAVLLFIFVALITAFPLKKEALVNSILTMLLVGFLISITAVLLPRAEVLNLATINFKNIFFPYGVLLFALSGGVAIPDLVTLLGKDRRKTRLAITFGSLIPAFLYLFFAAAVLGVSGSAVSPEAIAGLRPFVGERIIFLGSIIGFLAIFTSYLTLSKSFQEFLNLDLKLPQIFSWFCGTSVPFISYLLGFNNFIVIISVVGVVSGGIDAGLIVASYHKMQKILGEKVSSASRVWKVLLYFMIFAGIFYEIYKHVL